MHKLTQQEISTSNHMFGRVIWEKLLECIFENFEIEISNFSKSRGWFTPKVARTKHVVTG